MWTCYSNEREETAENFDEISKSEKKKKKKKEFF